MQQLHQVELEIVYTNEEQPAKENRTVLLNGVILSDKEIEREEQQNIVMRDLFLGAQSLSLARKMERERKEYFDELYEFSYGVSNISEEPLYLGSTESKALSIMEQKETYELKIVKLKERYSRFKGLLSGLNEHDSHLLKNYFEHGYKVDYEVLRECVKRLSKYLNKQEEARGKALDQIAIEEYAKQRKAHRIAESKAAAKKNEGKQQYLVDGRFVYMSPDEYEKHLKETEEQERTTKEWLTSMYIELRSNN